MTHASTPSLSLTTDTRSHHDSLQWAGALMTSGALGFVLVFAYLMNQFGYPDVLDHPASEVLPALLAGGASLRAVWAIYAILPLSIVGTALLSRGRFGLEGRADRLVAALGVMAGLSMMIGLSRWPTLQWSLASAWASGDHAAITAQFDALNLILGNGIGEFLGEVTLGGWFLGVGHALRSRWVGRATLLLSALLFIGSFRNMTDLVQPATDLTNNLLPAVMIWLGVHWMRNARV